MLLESRRVPVRQEYRESIHWVRRRTLVLFVDYHEDHDESLGPNFGKLDRQHCRLRRRRQRQWPLGGVDLARKAIVAA